MFPKSDVESDTGVGSGVVELVMYVVEKSLCRKLVKITEKNRISSVEELEFSFRER